MVWYDIAPVIPPDEVKYLGEMLEMFGAPLVEMAAENQGKDIRFYCSTLTQGRVAVAISTNGCNVFFSPPGVARFLDMWDWEECTLGKPRPKNWRQSTMKEPVDWILKVLMARDLPELDSELLEEIVKKKECKLARDRWLRAVYTFALYLVILALFIWSVATDSFAGMLASGIALSKMLHTTFGSTWMKFLKRTKGSN